jgi:hypothetical protein
MQNDFEDSAKEMAKRMEEDQRELQNRIGSAEQDIKEIKPEEEPLIAEAIQEEDEDDRTPYEDVKPSRRRVEDRGYTPNFFNPGRILNIIFLMIGGIVMWNIITAVNTLPMTIVNNTSSYDSNATAVIVTNSVLSIFSSPLLFLIPVGIVIFGILNAFRSLR